MDLKEQLNEAMKTAMKAKDAPRLSAIRMMKTAIINKEKEGGEALDDQAVIAVLSTLVKQRRESALAYRENDRPELAEKEEVELGVIQEFLPAQLSEDELKEIVEAAVAEAQASSMKEMGKVMKIVTAKTTGRADGKVVSEMVKARLSARRKEAL